MTSSPPKEEQYVTVIVRTKLGAQYSFPDMNLRTFENLLLGGLSRVVDFEDKKLLLTNASEAVLQIHCRIIKSLSVEYETGEVREVWQCGV